MRNHSHWSKNKLAGGLYGVALGGAFFGESMFHRVTDASKMTLVALVEHLRACGFLLFDIQMLTPITTQLGGITIARSDYLERLKRAIARNCSFESGEEGD